MEDNSFTALKKEQKKTKNHFIPENTLSYTQSLKNSPLIPTHSPILPNFANKIIACPEGYFTVTPIPSPPTIHPYFKKFVLNTHGNQD